MLTALRVWRKGMCVVRTSSGIRLSPYPSRMTPATPRESGAHTARSDRVLEPCALTPAGAKGFLVKTGPSGRLKGQGAHRGA
eukprot:5797579-Prymnesium_polylepis.1